MKRLIILIGLFILLSAILVVSFFVTKDEEPTVDDITPTMPVGEELSLVSSTPENQSENVPRTQEFTFSFNKPFDASEITIFISPETPYSSSIQGNILSIAPTQQWDEGTPYRIAIDYNDENRLPDTVDFTTEGEEVDTLPDTAPPDEEIEKTEQSVLQERPDIYLKNQTPYSTDEFTITAEYDPATERFVFEVAVESDTSVTEARSLVEDWMRSVGLSQEQIQNLSISYT